MKCRKCGKALIGQDAKSGRFSYYVCGTLIRKGAGTCEAPYLPKGSFEGLVVDAIKTRILTENGLKRLAALVAEEMESEGAQGRQHMDAVEAELADVERRLGRLYEALETGKLALADLAPRIQALRQRQEQLQQARQEIQDGTRDKRREMLDLRAVTAYVNDLRAVLTEGSLGEQKGFIKSFVREIVVSPTHALLRYTAPFLPDAAQEERAGVLSIVPSGGAEGTRTPDPLHAMQVLSQLSYSPTAEEVVRSASAGSRLLAAAGHCPGLPWDEPRVC